MVGEVMKKLLEVEAVVKLLEGEEEVTQEGQGILWVEHPSVGEGAVLVGVVN